MVMNILYWMLDCILPFRPTSKFLLLPKHLLLDYKQAERKKYQIEIETGLLTDRLNDCSNKSLMSFNVIP